MTASYYVKRGLPTWKHKNQITMKRIRRSMHSCIPCLDCTSRGCCLTRHYVITMIINVAALFLYQGLGLERPEYNLIVHGGAYMDCPNWFRFMLMHAGRSYALIKGPS